MGLPFILKLDAPFVAYQGADFYKRLQYKTKADESSPAIVVPIDPTTTFRMQVRDKYSGSNALLELTTANSGILVEDNDEGIISINITAAQLSAIGVPYKQLKSSDIPFKDFNFDLEMVFADGKVEKYMIGVLRIYAEVTR